MVFPKVSAAEHRIIAATKNVIKILSKLYTSIDRCEVILQIYCLNSAVAGMVQWFP